MNHEHTWSWVGTPSRSLPTTERLGGVARARRATVMRSSAVTASILAQTSCSNGVSHKIKIKSREYVQRAMRVVDEGVVSIYIVV